MEKRKYVPSQSVLEAQQALEEQKGKKPGEYLSPWKDALGVLLQTMQNRGPFAYDPNRDPLYRQAVDRYVRLGRQAMMDTLGQAAGLTGGYDNSYAQTAGQQSYQKYLLALSARLPQFQQMALERYGAEGKDLMDKYHVLSSRDQAGFDRYQSAVNRYYGELNRLQNAYDRARDRDYHAFQADRDFDYAREQDAQEAARLAEQAQREQLRFELQQAYQKERDKIKDQQWQQDFEEGRRRHNLEMQLRQAEAAARAAAAAHRGSSRGGSGSRGGHSYPNSGPMNRFSREEYYHWRSHTSPGRPQPRTYR